MENGCYTAVFCTVAMISVRRVFIIISVITAPTAGLPVVLKFLKCHRCPEIVLKSAIVLKFYSFGQNVLIWNLIFKFVAIRWHLLRLKCSKFDFVGGSAPDPVGGAYGAPPGRPLDGFELSNVN